MKTRKTAILLCLILCFTALFPIASAAGEDMSTQSFMLKDGIRAKISITSQDENIVANISVENKDCDYLGKIKCKLLLSEGITTSQTEITADPISIGDKTEFNFQIVKSEIKEPGSENNFDSRYIVIAVCILVIIAVGFVLRYTRRKNIVSMLLIGCILLPYFAFSAECTADAATRYILIGENVTIGEETYRVEAEIEYEYNFAEENVEKTSGMDGFQITYFYGPPGYGNFYVTDELVEAIADCGFTTIPLAAGEKESKRILDIMKKYGLTCSALYVGDITDKLVHGGNLDVTQEEVDAVVQKAVDTYAGYDNILGWNICDEPSADTFPVLQKIVSAFRRIDPDREVYINVWPNYASPEQLMAVDYNSYIEKYLSEVDPYFISYDYYHFTSETS